MTKGQKGKMTERQIDRQTKKTNRQKGKQDKKDKKKTTRQKDKDQKRVQYCDITPSLSAIVPVI